MGDRQAAATPAAAAPEGAGAAPAMDPEHLTELAALEEDYWWLVAKRRLVLEVLARHCPPPGLLVEGGIGSGRNLEAFARRGYRVVGLDLLPAAIERARARGLADCRVHSLEEPWPVAPGSAAAVVLLDVVEHADDPVRVLAHAAAALAPGGACVVTVPAYPWLYGPWDRALGHRRRYRARELARQAAAAGLATVRLTHWNAVTLPGAVVVRTLERLAGRRRGARLPRLPRAANAALAAAAALERRWLRRLPLPCGLSILGVFRR